MWNISWYSLPPQAARCWVIVSPQNTLLTPLSRDHTPTQAARCLGRMNPPEMWHTPFSWLFTTSQVRACWVSVNLTSFYFLFFMTEKLRVHDYTCSCQPRDSTLSLVHNTSYELSLFRESARSMLHNTSYELSFFRESALSTLHNKLRAQFFRQSARSTLQNSLHIPSSKGCEDSLFSSLPLRSLDHYSPTISRSLLTSDLSISTTLSSITRFSRSYRDQIFNVSSANTSRQPHRPRWLPTNSTTTTFQQGV